MNDFEILELCEMWFIERFGYEKFQFDLNTGYFNTWVERFKKGLAFAKANMDLESLEAFTRVYTTFKVNKIIEWCEDCDVYEEIKTYVLENLDKTEIYELVHGGY